MPTMKEELAAQDLGLAYEDALHGVQTGIGFLLSRKGVDVESHVGRELKHQRTGIDMCKSDQQGLAALLIDKGVFTLAEYVDYMRLAANAELRRYEKQAREQTGISGLNFR